MAWEGWGSDSPRVHKNKNTAFKSGIFVDFKGIIFDKTPFFNYNNGKFVAEGGMPEWLNGVISNITILARVSGVQILLPPQ